MFQTDLQIWFQQFDNDWIVRFFQFITALGYPQFLIVALLIIIFGINFKKGFVLLLILMWTTIITLLLKQTFDLPRPYMVNENVRLLDGEINTNVPLLADGSATFFFELLPQSTIDYFKDKDIPHGFPSGHTSAALAFWGALLLLFKKRWLIFTLLPLIVLIPLSRIYLGVHFIADVLGGYLIGAVLLWSFYRLVITPQKLEKYMNTNKHNFAWDVKNILIIIPPILWFFLLEDSKYLIAAGVSLGFGLGFITIAEKGLLIETGKIIHRINRVITAIVVFISSIAVLDLLGELFSIHTTPLFTFLKYTLASFILAWLVTTIHFKLKWVERAEV